MVGLNLSQHRVALVAHALYRAVAALHKAASIRQIDGSGNFALDDLAFRLILAHDGQRNSGKQRLSIGMQRILKEQVSRSLLYHGPHIHYSDIIGEIFYYGQIMSDEDIGQTQILLQLLKQIQFALE